MTFDCRAGNVQHKGKSHVAEPLQAGRTPGINAGTDNANTDIATVATMGYFGFLAGPALIGFTAELFTLMVALGLVVAGITLVGLFAHVARQAADGEETPPTPIEEELLLER